MFNDDTLKYLHKAAKAQLYAANEAYAKEKTDENKLARYWIERGVKELESLMRGDNIAIIWGIDDVQSLGEDEEGNQTTKISDQEARDALANVKHNHDASIGVNWDTLWDALLSVKESNEDGADDNTPE